MATLRACVVCARLSEQSRCPDHPARNGSTRQWRKTRARVLARDRQTCRYCGAPADTVDHVDPVANGGTDDDTNLAAACEPCNRAKGAT